MLDPRLIDSLTYRYAKHLSDADREAILHLWNTHYPRELCYTDAAELAEYLAGLHHSRHVLVEDTEQNLLGWLCTFERDSSEWFVIILDDKVQRKGLGSRLMEDIQASYASLRGWMLESNDLVRRDGSPYASPARFYSKLGFELADEVLEAKGLTFSKILWP